MRKCPMSLVIREMQFKITIKYKFALFLLFSCKGHFCDSTNCSLPGSSVHRILNTGVACHFLLQGLFPTQGSNPYFLLGRQILYHWATWEALVLIYTAAAAAKSLQSCPTLCNPIDGSPPGSTFPGILQARTLEWVAISFSNAWTWSRSVVSDS